ncbi:sugar ABC transporter permease [Alphaproteobacteria bacterium]|jgi:ABC-type sugar transport system permease subunit|nr:sugar ABC transporter permease [Alphaproteobacteria bacterium]NCF49690.1 ABC transporter permease subunit [Bacteroidota bacterium]
MPHRTFISFIWPSALAMLLFIALPIISVGLQSFYIEHEQVLDTVKNCGPFGCKEVTVVNIEANEALNREAPLGRFNGFGTYSNRNHLAFGEIGTAWRERAGFSDFVAKIMNLPFYKALGFTLAYTFVVTPLVIMLGFVVALAVNKLPSIFKGPTIFISLLPMIVTPLIGSLILFWMIDAKGILGGTLQILFDDPDLSLKASSTLTWITLMVYGVWHSAPFAFVVFYAGLQTVPQDTLESAMIDGANRWQTIRHVVIPHLMPLVVFISLIQLMDNFRVFEPIIGFNAAANATSLSWIIYNDLRGSDGTMLFGSAAATSMLTILGVSILLAPVIVRTWRANRRAA